MSSLKSIIGKSLYAFLFLIALPVLLFAWAKQTEEFIRFEVVIPPLLGMIIAIIGFILICWGMLALAVYGKGLPMNAFPPPHYVKKGPFRFFKHPIYWGFGMLIIGISVYFNSSSGLWLVTPVTILGMMALVWGFERRSLKKRFPNETMDMAINNNDEPPSLVFRLSIMIRIVLFYLISNYVILTLAGNEPAFFGGTWEFAFFPGYDVLSVLSLIFIFIPLFLINKQSTMRNWINSLIIGGFLLVYISLLWPELGGQFFIQSMDVNPSDFMTLLKAVPILYMLISLRTILEKLGKLKIGMVIIGVFLMINQLVLSNSSILHLLVSLGIFLVASNYHLVWNALRNLSNWIANSWKEWVFGPVRIINHGFYVGLGAFFGIFLAGWLAGSIYAWALLVFSIAVIIFSAIWAQIVEGSEKLKRPFGYYGALIGILFASFVVWLMGVNVWVIIGVVSVVMPWVQGIGRLRCLINGCCHGELTKNENLGIRYFHYRSRVCGVSDLKGALLQPTQLYAIIWLFFVGFILLKLWQNNFSYAFIFGLYLILTGMGRFVEEAYRGEVQTIVWNGLRLYQWTAIITVLVGIGMTCIPVEPVLIVSEFSWELFLSSLIGGFVTFFAMGVDFPNSNARFSRLV